ncbi:uncharacterized protein [Dysidea avara]|uniref:uncharacterized protein isoform X2 n=1 Tax=Dysidea avara TaxID=196820 RepID=UPI003322CA94
MMDDSLCYSQVLLVTLFIVPALTENFVRHCSDIQVRFSADNGSTQEVSCCMQNPSQCRWTSVHHPQVNASYREEQTGLILSWQPGIDLFGLYTCFNQMNGTEEQINFLPMEGDQCPSCMSVSTCATSTEIKLYVRIWFTEILIHSSCELHRNGESLQSIDLDNCVQMRQEKFDFDMDVFTVVCPITCDGIYRIEYAIPRSSFTNTSDCLTDEKCITPSPTRAVSSTELFSLTSQSESYGTISTAAVALTTVSSLPIPSHTSDNSTSDDIEIGIIVGVGVGVGGASFVIVIIVILFIIIRCKRNASITSTTTHVATGNGWTTEMSQRQLLFIMYTKEPDDPQGDKVLSLSDQLISYGIDCTIDHYYANDNIPDWSFWVTKHIEYCVASVHGYVLLVCSEEMFSILEETSGIVNIRIPMVYAHIDRLTLKNILGRNTPKFLPILIDDDKKTCVPPCLQGKSIFRFPYKRLINVINSQSVLDRPEFSSLRSLVATISGQRENPQPDNELGIPTVNRPQSIVIKQIAADYQLDGSSQSSFVEDLQRDATKLVKEESVSRDDQHLLT